MLTLYIITIGGKIGKKSKNAKINNKNSKLYYKL